MAVLQHPRARMPMSKTKRCLAASVVVALNLAAVPAWGDDGAATSPVPVPADEVPTTPLPADGASTDSAPADPPAAGGPFEQSVKQIEVQLAEEGLDASLVAQPLSEAHAARERARGANDAGDPGHGRILTKLASDWLDAAGTLVRAASREKKATALVARAQQLEQKVERARTLLAEQQARLGRLEAQVRKLEARHAAAADVTKEAERPPEAPKEGDVR